MPNFLPFVESKTRPPKIKSRNTFQNQWFNSWLNMKMPTISIYQNSPGPKSVLLTTPTPMKSMEIQQTLKQLFSTKMQMLTLPGVMPTETTRIHYGRAPLVDQNLLSGVPKVMQWHHGPKCSLMVPKSPTTSLKFSTKNKRILMSIDLEVWTEKNSECPTQKCLFFPPTLKWIF